MDGYPLLRLSLSRPLAVAASLAFTSSYVGVLYAFGSTRVGTKGAVDEHGRPLDRNHPRVIKRRLWSVAGSSVASVIGVWALARYSKLIPATIGDTLRLIGVTWPSSFKTAYHTVVCPLALTVSLCAGPLCSIWLDGRLWDRHDFTTLQGFRNVIAAPVLEELVFRACIGAVGLMAGMSRRQLIFVAPLYFGLAHVHHAWDVYVSGGRTRRALLHGLFGATAQFSYTYLMGAYASYLFLRTSSVVPPIAAHAFMNWHGLPDPVGEGRRHPHSRSLIYALYLAGIFTFATSLVPMTDPVLFGGSPFW